MKCDRVAWPPWSMLGGAPYTPSHATDIRDTFRKERERLERERLARERREADERDPANEEDAP